MSQHVTAQPDLSIGLISNCNSGHNRDQLPRINERVAACPNLVHCTTESAEDIPQAIATLSQSSIQALAINGGDGTASTLLGWLLEQDHPLSRLPIILLPGGTANMNAGDIGVKGKLLTATDKLCAWSQGQRPATPLLRSLLRVQPGTHAAPHYGMFLGAGAIVQGTEYAHQEIHSRGLRDEFSLALGTARTLWGLLRNDPRFARPVRLQLALNKGQDTTQHDASILAISSLQRLFMGIRPFWGNEPAPIQLTVIEHGSPRFLRTFSSILSGHPSRFAKPENGYISHNAEHISIDLDGSINLDGEIIHARSETGAVQISASKPLTFLRL